MSLKKYFIAILAVTTLSSVSQVEAVQPKKPVVKTAQKSATKKSTSSKTASNSKAKSLQQKSTLAKITESKPVSSQDTAITENPSGEHIVKTAMQYIGVPYRRGTSSPKSFDCSGFTSYVYKQHDITLSRTARSQFGQGKVIKNKSDLRVGDLVFFKGRSTKGGIGHVGIVTEVSPQDKTFKFVHASCTRGITTDKSTMAYYSKRYVGACRVLSGKADAGEGEQTEK